MSFLTKVKLGLAVFLMGTSAFSASAQCVVGGTDFETTQSLCNPTLPNDETGWFSEDPDVLATALSACTNTQYGLNYAIQKGMPSNVISTNSGFFSNTDAWTIENTAGDAPNAGSGYTVIMANPKLLDPILSEGNGTNMLVNAGTPNTRPFFSYSLSGLAPLSEVKLTLDAYYLVDAASVEASATAAAEDLKRLGSDIQYQLNTSNFQAQPTSISWTTALTNDGQIQYDATHQMALTS
ncbi:MAG TPA: hypothetical protein PKZ15_07530, partial [Paludibacteraceae bacterium]|nr:hypothetical protein [Paludibacteraceae bacterium]